MTLETRVDRPAAWTAESPNLYRVAVSLERGGKTLHTTTERFGFRTVELRPRDGLYVNGVKVRLKGVNRHSFWPDSGRTTSRAVSEMDVKLIKDMNMNAVRMSHYPPDRHFLETCDELGLFVLDELTGWQHRYDTEVGREARARAGRPRRQPPVGDPLGQRQRGRLQLRPRGRLPRSTTRRSAR